ncbi:beta strand repeat-containing protein [Flavobacterium sp. JP2137]|uniref:beta strand repeat-containing protein n=1 Tax=Flavobacterium sp. JP2137 TaxID=3414510 RepID=UPI003D2FFBFC
MKKRLLPLAALLLVGGALHAQVGVGTLIPNASAQMEIVSGEKGILIPRVNLTDVSDRTTITNGNVNSLLVFNLTENESLKKGYYYWLDTQWVRLISADQVDAFKNTVNVSVKIENNEWIITDSEGNEVKMAWNIQELIALNETETTLTNNGDGTYTYVNERGVSVIIDVPADVISNFQDIIDNSVVKNILNQFLKNAEGNVTYDGTNFYYTDANGINQVINLQEFVAANETETTLTNNGDGTYTYVNERGVSVIIDVPADVISNFQTIVDNTEVKNILNQFLKNAEGNVTYDGTNFYYTDANGINQVINLQEFVAANETETTLTNNGDGTYTYVNERGVSVIIDVPADVISNFQDIIDNSVVKNILNQFLKNAEGNVTYDGTNFYYTDANGDNQVINLVEWIKANETETTLTNNGDGTYTYVNERGVSVIIDVPADVISNFQDIIDNSVVKNILNQFLKNAEGNVTYDGTNFYYTDANGINQVINLQEFVAANETETTLTNNGDGTYTYVNERGVSVIIDVPADVISNFQDIIDNSVVKNILNQFLKNAEGNVTYDGTNFYYTDANGDNQIINLVELIKANETETTLTNNGDGTYTYVNERGVSVIIDVPADVISNFQDIIDNSVVKNILNQFLKNAEGNVTYDGTNFYYTDANGDNQIINLVELIKANETETTLTNNGDGTYTYVNERGVSVIIDVPADVISNFQDIIDNSVVKNILNQFLKNAEGNVTYDGTNFYYTDANGDNQVINLVELIKANETETTLTNNGDGTYTYVNERGVSVIIDVPADVISNFQDIIDNSVVKNILNQFLKNAEGNVTYDGTNFYYTDANGDNQIINLVELIKANETETTLTNNGDGTYTYVNERGVSVIIDVPADVISNFQDIIDNSVVKNILNQFLKNAEGNVTYDGTNFYYTDANGDNQIINLVELIKANETETTLTNNGDGTYTYVNERGVSVIIDVPADVISNFQDIIDNSVVKNILNQFLKNAEGNVTYDGTNFYYTDANGDNQVINLVELIKANETETTLTNNGDGTYTYVNERGVSVIIDVPADVISNFQDIIDNSVVKNILNQFLKNAEGNVTYDGTNFYYTDANGDNQVINLVELIKANETETTLTNNGDGTYTYVNERGVSVIIDVPADVISNFQDIIDNSVVKNILNQFLKNVDGIVTYDGTNFYYTDANGDNQVINLVELIKDNETLTSLRVDIDNSKLIYKDESETESVLDLAPLVQEPWFNTATGKGATSNTDNMYTNGWVGIGFTEPSIVPNEKLRVNGTITTVSSSYADYVFEDYFDGFSTIKYDYKFNDLETVANFIKTNRHLPGITPIGDLEQTSAGYSFNVSDLAIQLLEKTEELYLHVIEQKEATEVKDKDLQLQLSEQEKMIEEKNLLIKQLQSDSQLIKDRLDRLEAMLTK